MSYDLYVFHWTGGLDYDNSSQQITFTETNKVQTVYVPILNDAMLEEGEETFQFILTYDPSTKLNISTSSAQGMCIIDDNEGESMYVCYGQGYGILLTWVSF